MIMKYLELLARGYELATLSPDPSSQNGALIYDEEHDRVVSEGFNAPPVKYVDLGNRDYKLSIIEHAERAAIYEATFIGASTYECTMVCPWAACCDCARGIILSGIKKLVTHRERGALTPARWYSDVQVAYSMLKESKVEIIEVEGPIDAEPILISGELWSPRELEYV